MFNELIEKIEMFSAEKINGASEQRLHIHYNCVGVIKTRPAPEEGKKASVLTAFQMP